MTHVVHVPGPLRSYTAGAARLRLPGETLAGVLAALEQAHRGMRFRMIDEQDRIRPHIRIFVNTREAGSLAEALSPGDEIHLICALSGG